MRRRVLWTGLPVASALAIAALFAPKRAVRPRRDLKEEARLSEFLGEQSVKNIASPVRAYTVHAEQAAADDAQSAALEGRPKVAVLPFDNMSGTPDDEYFADGITEDIITTLSKNRWLSVVARNSAFVFKGQSVDVRHVAQELGAGYVVEGSVRKAGNQVRITAQLLDGISGDHIF